MKIGILERIQSILQSQKQLIENSDRSSENMINGSTKDVILSLRAIQLNSKKRIENCKNNQLQNQKKLNGDSIDGVTGSIEASH